MTGTQPAKYYGGSVSTILLSKDYFHLLEVDALPKAPDVKSSIKVGSLINSDKQ